MEDKQISNEEKAIDAEIKRIKTVKENLERLTVEYLHATEAWEAKKNEYIKRIDSMHKSIDSGEKYIQSQKEKLEKCCS